MDLSGYGITTTLPDGWEGRIMKRTAATAGQSGGPSPQFSASAAGAPADETFPVVHLANFAIPDDRGDFGSGAVELMGSGNLFITLFEYGPEQIGQALFSTQGLPRQLSAADFSPSALQRTITGQSGCQRFFTEAGRPFCLFIALGSHDNRVALVDQANAALATIVVDPH
jgi:hypothetical protein